ncbi:hypothetical protein [Streptomyces showdoensis]|uniref:hypothetical protein n=1 Tax=Streptomyces showdoensis TaxID=68268 RepID=UPI001F0AE23E|nr:hypothetical protein [Streptomyces showdoensis]
MTGAFQEDSAEGGTSAATVAQLQRRREAAGRCEPLHCGHRDPLDCDPACSGDEPPAPVVIAETVQHIPAEDAVQLWAEARSLYFAADFPKYASKEWRQLHPDDPRRLAGALDAAEMWRKYGDEEALLQWFRDATAAREPLWARRTIAELNELAKPKPPHQVTATDGWPPIKVPGTDTWRHNLDGRQIDLPHNRPRPRTYMEAAA